MAPTSTAVFFAAVSSAPTSSTSPTCWRTVYSTISPSLGASQRIRCCTISHVIGVEEQVVTMDLAALRNLCMAVYADYVGGSTTDFNAYWSSQVADSSLSIQAYESYSKELKNSVPKSKCILSTQVICQCIIEILADTAP
ncbi:hypothetical protein B0H14DRAFT_3515984 [Mycena olivaceomarginata]|nr:hypothetical protein B0H14DRAFT_3515984 [Mycena olivaceomarginata]